MENKIEFFIPLKKIPTTTHQQKRFTKNKTGKVVAYESEELKDVRIFFESRLANFVPKEKIVTPIELVTTWCFPETKLKKHGAPMTNKPDLDNIQKLFNDCMTKLGYWKDDSLIYRMILEKFHSEVVGIRVSIRY